MSEFGDATTWLKNGEVQLLFFVLGLHDVEDFDTAIPESLHPCFQFFDYREDSIYPVSLFEWRSCEEFSLDRMRQLIENFLSLLEYRALAVICMFDGAYLISEDLFESVNGEKIFAFQFNGERRLALDDDLRNSDDWISRVRRMQVDVRSKYNV